MGVNKIRTVVTGTLLFYIIIVLWFTVFNRPADVDSTILELYWSYRRWLSGDWRLGKQIIFNVIMFVPLGLLLSIITDKFKYNFGLVLILSILLSVLIETLQLFLMRGFFEFDDIINNTFGAIGGWGFYQILQKLTPKRCLKNVITALSITILAGCLFVFINTQRDERNSNISKLFCFQIDDLYLEGNNIKLCGITFRYDHQLQEPVISLKSINDNIEMDVKYGYTREGVNSYFKNDYEYINTGFMASCVVDPAIEYEVVVNYGWLLDLPTGVYITGTNIHYAPEDTFIPPKTDETSLDAIVQNGYLRVFRPEYHCWVYQYKSALYWIVDQDYYFEDDGSTYIQFQLWTTQPENLPQSRLDNAWYWDNIGGNFEDFEITETMDCGKYRVMKREIPTEYSITSIVTGYYKNGNWIWKNYFRPFYHFEID